MPAGLSRVELADFGYRDLTLTVTVTGSGTRVDSYTVDGVPRPDHRVPATLSGHHRVDIAMADRNSS